MVKKRNRKSNSYKLLDDAIRQVYLHVIESEGRLPTQDQVAEKLGITPRTVRGHIKNITLGSFALPLKVLTPNVMIALYNRAVGGDTGAIRTWVGIVHGFHDTGNTDYLSLESNEQNRTALEAWIATGKELLEALRTADDDEDVELEEKGGEK